MTSFLSLLPADGWPRLLCDALWQSTLIAAIGLFVARFIVRQSAARAWLLLLTLTACFLAPLASWAARQQGFALFAAPATNVAANQTLPEPPVEPGAIGTIDESTKPTALTEKPPVLPGVENAVSPGVGNAPNVVAWSPDHATAPTAGLPVGDGAGDLRSSHSAGSGDPRTTAEQRTTIPSETNYHGSVSRGAPPHPGPLPGGEGVSFTAFTWIAIAWLIASIFLIVRLTLSLAATWRLLRRAEPCHDSALLSAANSAAQRIGLSKVPPLLISPDVQTPTIFCLGRTRLLVPNVAASLRDAELECEGSLDSEMDDKLRKANSRLGETRLHSVDWVAAFTHELAHVKRGDGWSRLWTEIVAIALPLSPLVWLARRAFHTACEEACDDWAVAAGANPVDLAETLTAWINVRQHPALLAAIGMSSTKARTLRLLALRGRPTTQVNRVCRWACAPITVLLITGLAIAQSGPPAAKSDPSIKSKDATDDKPTPADRNIDAVPPKDISPSTEFVEWLLSNNREIIKLQNEYDKLAVERVDLFKQSAELRRQGKKGLDPKDDARRLILDQRLEQIANEIKTRNEELRPKIVEQLKLQQLVQDSSHSSAPGQVTLPPLDDQIEKALADDALVTLYARQRADAEKDLAQALAEPGGKDDFGNPKSDDAKYFANRMNELADKIAKRKAAIRPRITEELSDAAAGNGRATQGDKSDHPGLGPYVIEPPDILLLDPIQLSPKKMVRIVPGDKVRIDVEGTKYDAPINNLFKVDSAGEVVLGPAYGTLKISGLTRREAEDAVEEKLRETLNNPRAALTIDESRLQDGIAGKHLVAPDGTINLGTYGQVKVDGMTIEVATKAIRDKLATFFLNPVVSVDVSAYNSKVYYVIIKQNGVENIQRFPITGNESVIDAVAQVPNLNGVSKAHIFIARHQNGDTDESIEISWQDIISGKAKAKFQIQPGDRIFIEATRSAYAPEPSGQGDSVAPYYGAPVPPSAYPPSRSDSNPMKLPHLTPSDPNPLILPHATAVPEPRESRDHEPSVDFGQPVVVKTIPEAGTKDVDPNLTEIKVTFSREMTDGDWSFTQTSDDSYPKTTGDPHYMADKRTCVLPVKLEPGKTYSIWLNAANYDSFQDTAGHSAAPYLLVFKTKDAGAGIK